MLRISLKIAWRTNWRHRSFSFNSILSLAISLAACLVLVLLLYQQWEMDRHHADADRVYRVLSQPDPGQAEMASTPARLGPALAEQYTGVEAVTRLRQTFASAVVDEGRFQFTGFYADPTFFEVFDWPIVAGQPANALTEPFQVFVTQQWAERVFGDENPVGRTIQWRDTPPFTVAGVIDRSSVNSHLSFDIVASFATLTSGQLGDQEDWGNRADWTALNYYTYLKLDSNVRPDQLDTAFEALRTQHYPEAESGAYTFRLQPITEIALGPYVANDPAQGTLPRFGVVALVGLALLVLFAGGLTYVNLSLARAFERTREVGIRKTVGAQRWEIALQFLVEGVLIAFLALVGAVCMLVALVPIFNDLYFLELVGVQADMRLFRDPLFLAVVAGGTLLVGVLTAAYPALILSRPQPSQILSGEAIGRRSQPKGRSRLRRMLLGAQLTLACILIFTTILIYQQGTHMLETDYGFDVDRLVHVQVREAPPEALSQEIRRIAGVEEVAGIAQLPLLWSWYQTFLGGDGETRMRAFTMDAAPNTLSTLGVELVAGRMFRTTEEPSLVVNQAATRQLGFDAPEDAVGTTLQYDDSFYQIVGVMEDFHHRLSLDAGQSTGPTVIVPLRDDPAYFLVRAAPGQHHDIMEHLEAVWQDFDPAYDMAAMPYTASIDEFFEPLRNTRDLMGATALFVLFIAALGMLGMATYASNARMKEVGVRKALGASAVQLTALLSKEFVAISGVALAVGLPVSWLINRLWLDFLAHRIDIGPGVFLATAAAILVVTLSTAGAQTWRAAQTNPAVVLRDA